MRVGEGSKIFETAKILKAGRDWAAQIEIGKNCLIGDFTFVAVRRLVMDDGAQISPHAVVSGGGEVRLGQYSVVGFGVQLISGTDTTSSRYMCEAAPPSERRIIAGSITLGKGAYIGANAVICVSEKCMNIVIGDFAVVGSLSYVDRSVPAHTIIHPKMDFVITQRHINSSTKP